MWDNKGIQYIIAIVSNLVAAALFPFLPKWLSTILIITTISIAAIIILREQSYRILLLLKRSKQKWPWEMYLKEAGSDDPGVAIQAIDKTIDFIQKNPDLCLNALDSLHRKVRPDMSRHQEVRYKYARFRMYALSIMAEGHYDLIGSIVSTLKDLLSSRWDDVRSSATTELGQLCRYAADQNIALTRNWRNICFDLLDKTIIDFFARNWTHNLKTLIPHTNSASHSPEIFREIFAHIVNNVTSQGQCKPEYIDVMCDLLVKILPDMIPYIRSVDINTLIGCSNLLHNINMRMNTDKYLKLFADVGNHNRVWRRLHLNSRVSTINIICNESNSEKCSQCSCAASDISLRGICSQKCMKNSGIEMSLAKIILDIGGVTKVFNLPKTKIVREFKDGNGNRIEGAGIEIVDWGQDLRPLSDIIIEKD